MPTRGKWDHVISILILGMYQCHMMALVVQMIQELGVKVKHIPSGCTSLCQPVGVGLEKPFKDRMRRQWQWITWMISKGVLHGNTSPPLRADIKNWVNSAMMEMEAESEIIQNTWRRHRYEWYLGNEDVGKQVLGGNKDGEEKAI